MLYKLGVADDDLSTRQLKNRLIDLAASSAIPMYVIATLVAIYDVATGDPYPRWAGLAVLVGCTLLRRLNMMHLKHRVLLMTKAEVQAEISARRDAINDPYCP